MVWIVEKFHRQTNAKQITGMCHAKILSFARKTWKNGVCQSKNRQNMKKTSMWDKKILCSHWRDVDGQREEKIKTPQNTPPFFELWPFECSEAQKSVQMGFWGVYQMCAGKGLSNPKMWENFIHLWFHGDFFQLVQKSSFFEKIDFLTPRYDPPVRGMGLKLWLSKFFTKPNFHAKFQAILKTHPKKLIELVRNRRYQQQNRWYFTN